MITTDEEVISSCLEFSGFFDKDNVLKSIQNKYDFYYKKQNYKFKDKHIQENFVNFYGLSLSECNNVKGCKLHDDGKGYYVILNNCLLDGKCIETFIYDDKKNCLEFFDYQVRKIPINLQKFNLITANKEYICKIKTGLLEKQNNRK